MLLLLRVRETAQSDKVNVLSLHRTCHQQAFLTQVPAYFSVPVDPDSSKRTQGSALEWGSQAGSEHDKDSLLCQPRRQASFLELIQSLAVDI